MNFDPDDVLLLAAHVGLLSDTELGLRHGASPNLVDESGYPVLHLGALSNHPGVVKLLLTHGAEIDAVDGDGLTAMQRALNASRFLTVHALLMHGCSVQVVWPDGGTVLHKLAQADRCHLMDEAIQLGADVHARDKENRTPLMVAASHDHERCVQMLLNNGANLNDLRGVTLSGESGRVVTAWRASQTLVESR